MTDEHHPDDVARAKEAWDADREMLEKACDGPWSPLGGRIEKAMIHAARLGREGWKPPVDPDLLLARKCAAEAVKHAPTSSACYANGTLDNYVAVQAALRAIKITKGEAQ